MLEARAMVLEMSKLCHSTTSHRAIAVITQHSMILMEPYTIF